MIQWNWALFIVKYEQFWMNQVFAFFLNQHKNLKANLKDDQTIPTEKLWAKVAILIIVMRKGKGLQKKWVLAIRNSTNFASWELPQLVLKTVLLWKFKTWEISTTVSDDPPITNVVFLLWHLSIFQWHYFVTVDCLYG